MSRTETETKLLIIRQTVLDAISSICAGQVVVDLDFYRKLKARLETVEVLLAEYRSQAWSIRKVARK